jgi:hypothetical protein
MKVVALGLFAAIIALSAPTSAAADPITVSTVQADLNGDGIQDTVTARQAADDPNQQTLTAKIGRMTHVARAPMDAYMGMEPLRVADLNADGKDEVFVTEIIGANTLHFSVWGMNRGWTPLRNADGTQLRLYEGGGLGAIDGYGCEFANGRFELFTVSAYLDDWDNYIYIGEKVNYLVQNGVATEVSHQPITGPREAFPQGHAMCA